MYEGTRGFECSKFPVWNSDSFPYLHFALLFIATTDYYYFRAGLYIVPRENFVCRPKMRGATYLHYACIFASCSFGPREHSLITDMPNISNIRFSVFLFNNLFPFLSHPKLILTVPRVQFFLTPFRVFHEFFCRFNLPLRFVSSLISTDSRAHASTKKRYIIVILYGYAIYQKSLERTLKREREKKKRRIKEGEREQQKNRYQSSSKKRKKEKRIRPDGTLQSNVATSETKIP